MPIIPFWIYNPSILINTKYILAFIPKSTTTYEENLNALTRGIILITLLGTFLFSSIRFLLVGIFSISIICLYYQINKELYKQTHIENFIANNNINTDNTLLSQNPVNKDGIIINPETLEVFLKTEFKPIHKKNPFGNVLLTEILDTPNRLAAPPCFNPYVEEEITKNIKKTVQMLNPSIKNTNKQLYGDLWESYNLDQSNRAFYSMPNTKIVNDQGTLAQYLYSDLKYSGKESTPEGAIARVQNSYRYTLN